MELFEQPLADFLKEYNGEIPVDLSERIPVVMSIGSQVKFKWKSLNKFYEENTGTITAGTFKDIPGEIPGGMSRVIFEGITKRSYWKIAGAIRRYILAEVFVKNAELN